MVYIFVMAPGHMYLIKTTIFRVDSQFALIGFIVEIRILIEKFRKNNFIRIGTSYWESIPDYGPLWFPK
ncbi:hypothetical protein D3C71_1719280 [compost metagenome]